jgi:hypothetical protein
MDMELPLNLNPVKERRVKHSVGCICELCGGAYPSDLLEIHLLPGDRRRVKPGTDLQREILVLCPRCHREIHKFRLPRADQKTLVRSRPAGVRREIRAILGYTPRPYTPPDADLAAVFEETRQFSTLFVNGAG